MQSIKAGPEEDVTFKTNFEFGSLLFLTGCLVIAGIFALGLFWFRPSDISGLLFMFFCLFYAYWVLSSDYHFIYNIFEGLNWGIALRLQYIFLGLAVIFYTDFMKLLAEPYIKVWLFHIVSVVTVLMIGTVVLADIPTFTLSIPIYYMFLATAFMLISVLALEDFNFTHKLAWVNIIGVRSFNVGYRPQGAFAL
ncbi:MAG: 7TM diverse intracellular signaling domain-containing protein [Owenweeksia sp.]|nr:7TM diverse intracellular signaling domain-containing protein [Owenweeksia sp.]